jgi:hypothetical protein
MESLCTFVYGIIFLFAPAFCEQDRVVSIPETGETLDILGRSKNS